jgi:hypothetical protein
MVVDAVPMLLRDVDKKAFVQKELDHFASILKSKLKRNGLSKEKAEQTACSSLDSNGH